MLIKLTLSNGKMELYLDSSVVKGAQRNPQNLLETIVITNLLSIQGPMHFAVTESPTEVAEAVNRLSDTGSKIALH